MKMLTILAAIVMASLAATGCSTTSSGGGVMPTAYATSGGNRNVALLSDEPQAVTFYVAGQEIVRDPAWTKTGRGYEATVSYPVSLMAANSAKFVRADGKGWSKMHPNHMAYLREHDVTKSDPVCVGGLAWCATRGL